MEQEQPAPEEQPAVKPSFVWKMLLGRLLIFMLVLGLATFLFLYAQKISNESAGDTDAPPAAAQSAKAPSTPPFIDTCSTEEYRMVGLIHLFETLQTERSDHAVLELFTPAESEFDRETYAHLSGSDAGNLPRLYSTEQTNFIQPAYAIISYPKKNARGMCQASVLEQRRYYPQGVGGEYSEPQAHTVYFTIKKHNDAWMIDGYLNDPSSTDKFSGWGFQK